MRLVGKSTEYFQGENKRHHIWHLNALKASFKANFASIKLQLWHGLIPSTECHVDEITPAKDPWMYCSSINVVMLYILILCDTRLSILLWMWKSGNLIWKSGNLETWDAPRLIMKKLVVYFRVRWMFKKILFVMKLRFMDNVTDKHVTIVPNKT